MNRTLSTLVFLVALVALLGWSISSDRKADAARADAAAIAAAEAAEATPPVVEPEAEPVALPVAGFSAPETEAEKEAFGTAVRAYLLENPEVLIEVINELEQRQAEAQASDDATLVALHAEALFEDGYSHVTGNPEGDVTIVEFFDYRCTYCKQAFPDLEEMLESDGNIRLILKELPVLGEASVLAARFAISAQVLLGDEAYGILHDAMMVMRGNVTEDSLLAQAEALGLDGAAILEGMSNPAIDDIIASNYQLAGLMQISGTPGFIVGDQVLRGYLPLAAMEGIVAEVRAAQ